MTLKEASENVGKRVLYKPFKGCSEELFDYGVIVSTNNRNVFVLYDSDRYNSKATKAEDIQFI